MSCTLPSSHRDKVPSAVSLVEHPCDKASNLLKVIFDKPEESEKKNFGVCQHFMHGLNADMSARLSEWIELLHALGADKIFLYNLGIHPNVSKVP